MSNIIDSIQLSGSSYDVRDKSATTVVEITQSDYDNLPSSAKTSNILYIITDGSIDYITSGQCQTQINNSISGKQDTLVSGTNIKTINNESILGSGNIEIESGGGKAVSGGTNISITTGETADTINCTLPITATSSVFNAISVGANSGGGSYNTLIGPNARCDNNYGHNVFLVTQNSSSSASGAYVNGTHNVIIGAIKDGYLNFSIPSFSTSQSVVIGGGGISTDKNNSVAIGYQANVSGTTKTNINNQLKIDTSNQVYIYNKDNTEMICLQDQLGGGGSSYTAGDGIDITNDVISVTGKVDTTTYNTYTAATATAIGNKLAVSDFNSYSGSVDTAINSKASQSDLSTLSGTVTAHTANTDIHVTIADKSSWNGAATNASNAVTALGGLSIVKLTQAQYDSLATKDNSTLYVIVN